MKANTIVVGDAKMTRVFTKAEDFENFRDEYRRDVVPVLEENRRCREASVLEAMKQRVR